MNSHILDIFYEKIITFENLLLDYLRRIPDYNNNTL